MGNSFIKPDSEYFIVNFFDQLTNKGYELVIDSDGDKWYRLDGKTHRESQPNSFRVEQSVPAIVFKNGYQAYMIHNKYHRLDGPARIWPDGKKAYFINNVYYSENEYIKELMKCIFCKYEGKDKTDLLVHYDYEEEKSNLISHQLRKYLRFFRFNYVFKSFFSSSIFFFSRGFHS